MDGWDSHVNILQHSDAIIPKVRYPEQAPTTAGPSRTESITLPVVRYAERELWQCAGGIQILQTSQKAAVLCFVLTAYCWLPLWARK